MFCINCGTQIADDSVFCYMCGTKIHSVSEPAPEPVFDQIITEEPVYQTQPTFQEQLAFQTQQVFQEQPVFQDQVAYQQPIVQTKYVEKKASKAIIPAIMFAVLSLISSIAICIFGFMNKELGMGIENIAFALTAILVVVYAISKSYVSSLVKGILFIASAVLHTIYFCIPGAGLAIKKLTDFFDGTAGYTGTDCYYGIVMVTLIIFFAIYMLMNIIRSLINSKKASMLMVVSGYFTVLLVVVCFAIDFASKIDGLLAFSCIPIDLGFITLVLADIFAVISRAKKFEN